MTAETGERTTGAAHQGTFHPLAVAAVEELSSDAVAVTFDVPPELADTFSFAQGQHLTLRCVLNGREVRRNYSICSPAPDGPLRIGVKRLPGGAFSQHATTALRPGDVLDVLPPTGRFRTALEPESARRHVAVAGGSGITPVFSLAATTLAAEPRSTFTLVYANRWARDAMLLEELQDLKDRYPSRFQLLHVLSRESGESPLCSGRVDADKLAELFATLTPPGDVDHWYLCGPAGMAETARDALAERGVPTGRVHTELFHVDDDAPAPRPAETPAGGGRRVTFTLGGRTSTVDMPPDADARVLGAVLQARDDAPFGCRGGVCGTCRARLCEGQVDMARNYALEPDEVAAGYVLTCQSRPVTGSVTVDYDA